MMFAPGQILQRPQVRHLIDWSVFAAGATSLGLALALTMAALFLGNDAVADAPAATAPELIQAS